MKSTFLIAMTLICFSNSYSQEKDKNDSKSITTYYFIRHAEKDRTDPSDKNPHLTEIGNARAKRWSDILGEVKFDAVYSTNYHRTRETAQPTAAKNNLEITIYDSKNINKDSFKSDTKGKTVLIVGHSNTTPEFVNKILDHNKYDDIDDSNNGNLYIVTISGTVISDQLLVIN